MKGQTLPASPETEKWYKNFVPIIPKFISEYGIKPNPTSVRSGIDSIIPGLKELEVSLAPDFHQDALCK